MMSVLPFWFLHSCSENVSVSFTLGTPIILPRPDPSRIICLFATTIQSPNRSMHARPTPHQWYPPSTMRYAPLYAVSLPGSAPSSLRSLYSALAHVWSLRTIVTAAPRRMIILSLCEPRKPLVHATTQPSRSTLATYARVGNPSLLAESWARDAVARPKWRRVPSIEPIAPLNPSWSCCPIARLRSSPSGRDIHVTCSSKINVYQKACKNRCETQPLGAETLLDDVGALAPHQHTKRPEYLSHADEQRRHTQNAAMFTFARVMRRNG